MTILHLTAGKDFLEPKHTPSASIMCTVCEDRNIFYCVEHKADCVYSIPKIDKYNQSGIIYFVKHIFTNFLV